MAADPWLLPDWPAPGNIRALSTTRQGGVGSPPYQGFNLGLHVGDDASQVQANRQRLQRAMGHPLFWVEQVHACEVRRLSPASRADLSPRADAIYTQQAGQACVIMTADCLPVLFCSQDGREVAVAHAGWRGLAAGVLEATLACFSSEPTQIMAWLGPAIGVAHFQVGEDVRQAFLTSPTGLAQPQAMAACFQPDASPDKWCADLFALARLVLGMSGVGQIYGGGLCSYQDQARFYSYRRDGRCGRMATAIVRLQ